MKNNYIILTSFFLTFATHITCMDLEQELFNAINKNDTAQLQKLVDFNRSSIKLNYVNDNKVVGEFKDLLNQLLDLQDKIEGSINNPIEVKQYKQDYNTLISKLFHEILKDRIPVNSSDAYNRSLLHHATSMCIPELVNFLLYCKANVNYRNLAGETPIFSATRPEILKLLLDAGALANIESKLTLPHTFVEWYLFNYSCNPNHMEADRFIKIVLAHPLIDLRKQESTFATGSLLAMPAPIQSILSFFFKTAPGRNRLLACAQRHYWDLQWRQEQETDEYQKDLHKKKAKMFQKIGRMIIASLKFYSEEGLISKTGLKPAFLSLAKQNSGVADDVLPYMASLQFRE